MKNIIEDNKRRLLEELGDKELRMTTSDYLHDIIYVFCFLFLLCLFALLLPPVILVCLALWLLK